MYTKQKVEDFFNGCENEEFNVSISMPGVYFAYKLPGNQCFFGNKAVGIVNENGGMTFSGDSIRSIEIKKKKLKIGMEKGFMIEMKKIEKRC